MLDKSFHTGALETLLAAFTTADPGGSGLQLATFCPRRDFATTFAAFLTPLPVALAAETLALPAAFAAVPAAAKGSEIAPSVDLYAF